MKIEQIISDAAVKAVKALYGIEAAPGTTVPQKTKKEFEGNLTLVVFPFLKASHKAPEATAQEIGEYLLANEPAVASFNVIKGFLNLVIAPSFWSQMLHHIDEEADFGTHKAAADAPLVMVEYSSPNTNKPLHLGHVRNNLLGYSLSEILKANGNRVVKTNIVNDRGIHICKSMLAWQKWGDGVTPEKAGKNGDHLIGDFYVLFDKHYKQELKELEDKGVLERPYIPEYATHNAHMYYIKVKDLRVRTKLLAYLKERGILSVFHYVPLHSATAGKKFGRFHGEDVYTTKESERLCRLPMYYSLSLEEAAEVVKALKEFPEYETIEDR